MLVQEPVQAVIWHCLNNYDYQDAIFLAERLCAEVDSEEACYLLATCYYRSGKPGQAYSFLRMKSVKSPQCKYLLARCCLELQKLSEGEAVILQGLHVPRSLDDLISEYGDQACFVLLVLARIYSETERERKSSEALRLALKLNPFLWKAFEVLCNRGEKMDPNRSFQVKNFDNFAMCHGSNPVVNFFNSCSGNNSYSNNSVIPTSNDHNYCTPIQVLSCLSNASVSGVKVMTPEENPLNNLCSGMSDISSMSGMSGIAPLQFSGRIKPRRSGNMYSNTIPSPSFGILPLDSHVNRDIFKIGFRPPGLSVPTLTESNDQKSFSKRVRAHVGQLISRKESPLQHSKPVFSQSGNTSNSNIVSTPTPLQGQNVRRSSRLFSSNYSVKENTKSPNRNKFAVPKSPSRKSKSRLCKTNLSKTGFDDLNERTRIDKDKMEELASALDHKIIGGDGTPLQVKVTQHAMLMQKNSAEGLMGLLRDLGVGYVHLAQYNCKKAIEYLLKLPSQHKETAWVLCLLGKAYYEVADYPSAIKYFEEVRAREPYQTDLMEIYSTCLWHLQKEVALSELAQDLVATDRNTPSTWCVAGNCFSLQKEHDIAIKYFHRAIQIEPSFVYAYTLLGHEYVMTEELDKALSCFRNAIRIDCRHYNAWYGIGTIFSKQERFNLAEIHYKRALDINPRNVILLCHIAVVQNALQKTEKALDTLNIAISIEPKNPLCKFHRASIYFGAGRHAEALKELEELKGIVPKESLVYYLTGKVHKKLGNTHLALMHFSWATDLDPKGANSQIKEAIDPAVNRSMGEDDSIPLTGDNFMNDSSSGQVNELSQEDGFGRIRMTESDESL